MKTKIIFTLLVFISLAFVKKSEAVVHVGGHLTENLAVYDEVVHVDSTIFNNGYEIYFENCQIYFAQDAYIEMIGSQFHVEGTGNIFRGLAGARWRGIHSEGTDISIENTRFLDIKRDAVNLGYALDLRNPVYFFLHGSSITPISSVDSSTSGIFMTFSTGILFTPVVIIQYDTIRVNRTDYAINIDSYSPVSGNFQIKYNVLDQVYDGGAGIILVGLEDVILTYNQMHNWSNSIYNFSASADFWANYFYSLYSNRQIWGESEGMFDLSSDAGGYNTLWTSSGNCIELDDSYFYMKNGGNHFLKEDTTVNYFAEGYFPSNSYNDSQDVRGNCFFETPNIPLDSAHVNLFFNVKLPNQTPVNFRMLPFGSCVTDELTSGNNNSTDVLLNVQQAESNRLYTEMSAAHKSKQYSVVIDKCKEIIRNGSNNMETIEAIRKLYNAVCMSNTSVESRRNEISSLKSLFEIYWNNRSLSPQISAELFYYLQKAKVVCGEYESALAGYKSMMESNKAGSKSMLAKWEYEGLKNHMASIGKFSSAGVLTSQQIAVMIQDDLKKKLQDKPQQISSENKQVAKLGYELSQNYPNPFNPVTTIHYNLPSAGFVKIKIYDIIGRMVGELVNEFKDAGSYKAIFDGSKLSSGIYYYKLESANFTETKRMLLIK